MDKIVFLFTLKKTLKIRTRSIIKGRPSMHGSGACYLKIVKSVSSAGWKNW